MKSRNIKSVDVSETCYESIPCQHTVTINYDNGISKALGKMRSPDIEREYGQYILYGNTHGKTWAKHPEDFAAEISAYLQNKKEKDSKIDSPKPVLPDLGLELSLKNPAIFEVGKRSTSNPHCRFSHPRTSIKESTKEKTHTLKR